MVFTGAGETRTKSRRNNQAQSQAGKLAIKTGYDMLKKLFAAALCGIVIASIASHADAAGPGSFARSYASIERSVVASALTESEKADFERDRTLMMLDHYFERFDQTPISI